jgi:hypothetical protein
MKEVQSKTDSGLGKAKGKRPATSSPGQSPSSSKKAAPEPDPQEAPEGQTSGGESLTPPSFLEAFTTLIGPIDELGIFAISDIDTKFANRVKEMLKHINEIGDKVENAKICKTFMTYFSVMLRQRRMALDHARTSVLNTVNKLVYNNNTDNNVNNNKAREGTYASVVSDGAAHNTMNKKVAAPLMARGMRGSGLQLEGRNPSEINYYYFDG